MNTKMNLPVKLVDKVRELAVSGHSPEEIQERLDIGPKLANNIYIQSRLDLHQKIAENHERKYTSRNQNYNTL